MVDVQVLRELEKLVGRALRCDLHGQVPPGVIKDVIKV